MVTSKFIRDNINRFNSNVYRFYDRKYIRAWLDESGVLLLFRCSPDDYFRYEFFRKLNYERNKFIIYRQSKKIISEYNNSEKTDIFNNKVMRDWGQVHESCKISKAKMNDVLFLVPVIRYFST